MKLKNSKLFSLVRNKLADKPETIDWVLKWKQNFSNGAGVGGGFGGFVFSIMAALVQCLVKCDQKPETQKLDFIYSLVLSIKKILIWW